MLGLGIAGWFLLSRPAEWMALILVGLALSAAGAMDWRGRGGRAAFWAGLAIALGCALIWVRAERLAAPVLERPAVVEMRGRVIAADPLPARDMVRLTIAPEKGSELPPRVRVNAAEETKVAPGAIVRLRARLMPPADAAVPGAYDFRRVAWFLQLGATGRALSPVEIISGGDRAPGLRDRLTAHIQAQLPGSVGGVASALVTGDRGAISEKDDEALRRAGLTHLLSVSGLHVTAVVGATFLVVLRLLALSPWLALRAPLRLIAAGVAAAAAVGYTLLAGAEVPTIRSCVAALLVLLALALGREAITMRLVAAGAAIVLLVWPESLAGPSFQLSFAAVASIVALHEHARVKALLARREEGLAAKTGRVLLSLLLTGVAVEIALMPIVLFHFHKAGLYGAAANIVAIPLTTFVIMPLEALALLLDPVGLGAPVWWLAGLALQALLALAHAVAAAPGSVTAIPHVPDGAFALVIAGGLWLLLWHSRLRLAGLAPIAAGLIWIAATPPPDLLVTGDGRHAAIRTGDGLALLRARAGDYVRDTLAENGGAEDELADLAAMPNARCSADLCVADIARDGRTWRILATRSSYFVDIADMAPLCTSADIAISDRRLPGSCTPRWLKLDRAGLERTGGVAITFDDPVVRTVRKPDAEHPWRNPETVMPPR
ncbi:ComEC/Rec2 family competence protein [Sphingomonas gilva]|nr:ComEC/Rec2 family competence protein [Sphingomonas gilva]